MKNLKYRTKICRFTWASLLLGCIQSGAFDGSSITPVGIHPDFISEWNGNPYFCDFKKIESRNWLITNTDWEGVLQDLNPSLINSDGYPIAMPTGSYINRAGVTVSIPAGSYFFTNPGQGGDLAAREGYQGRYVLTWKGEADLRAGYGMQYVSGDGETGAVLNGRRVYKTLAGSALSGFRVEVRALGGTPITDIRVSMPDPADPWNKSLETGTFHPAFLNRLADRDWAYIRFMNMMSANGNPQRDWVDRRKPNHCFQEGVIRTRTSAPADYVIYDDGKGTIYRPTGNRDTGMSFEYMVELCNTTGKDLWLTVPHMATDDFLNKLALLIAYGSDGTNPYYSAQSNPIYQPLRSDLNIYLEFSNEIWQWPNDTFSQTIWVKTEADKSNIEVPVFNARQFSRLWKIFETYIPVYRVHRVAAILAADGGATSYTGKFINELYSNPSLLKPEILSPATYFGSNIQGWVLDNIPNLPGNPSDAYWTSVQFENDLKRMFDVWEGYIFAEKEYGANSGPDAVSLPGGFHNSIHDIAVEKGLALVAYEGGPSIYTDKMNTSGESYDDGITIFMNESNRRDRIMEMYLIHMNQGLERGMQSHSMFTLSGKWSKYGQWGHLEYLMQNPATATKYVFMENWFDAVKTLRSVDFPIGSKPYFTTTPFLPLFEVGTFQSQTIGYDSSTLKVDEVATILPAGLYFNLETMTVSGTPTAAGKGYIYLMIEDADSDPAWRTFEVTVLADVVYGPDATVTFESVAAASVGSGNYKLESYSEAGYTFENVGSALDVLGVNEEFESQVIQNVGWNQKITLRNANPNGFINLTSFDYAAGRWGGTADAIVTGYFISGETKSVTVSSGTKVMATKIVNWDGLVKVEFDYDGGATQSYGTLDNIVLTGAGGGTVTPPVKPPVEPPVSGGITITFEDRAVGTMTSGIYYDLSGYTFSDAGWLGPKDLEIFGVAEGYESKVLENYSWNRSIEMTKTDGGVFDLTSFDHASGRWDGLSDALVTATFENGEITTISVSSSTKAMATRTVNWTKLKKVSFNYAGGATDQYGALDNFVLGGGTAVPVNAPPVANAGVDQTVVDSDGNGSQSVTVYGSGTDSDGWITTYVWTEGGVIISTAQNPVGNLTVGAHTLTLTVTDNGGAMASDTVLVTVNAAPVTGGAVTLTFEGVAVGTIAGGIYYDPAGFTFRDVGWLGPKDLEIFGVAEGYESNVLENYSWNRIIEMTKTNGGVFELVSFDYATGRWDGVSDAVVTATFENGATTTISVSSSTKAMATRTVNWTNLKKVTFDYAGGASDQYGAVDNVVTK